MSFSTDTKSELARIIPEKKCCQLADIAGFIRVAGSISLAGGGKFRINMSTSSLAVVRHYKTLIKNYFSVDIQILQGQGNSLDRGSSTYYMSIGPEDRSEQILREMGILMVREGMNYISDGIYDGLIRNKCCRKSYLRGAFLAAGTVSNPEKGYHLEITVGSEMLARDVKKIFNNFVDINAKYIERKNGYGVYLKAREQIRDMLAIMGASTQFFEFDNVIMMKDIMSKTYRENNLDNANIDKALKAAEHHIQCIKKIERLKGLDYLSPKLKEAAVARLENPDLGIEDLGKIMDPPLSKSGINNRLRKIVQLAEKINGGIK